MRKQRDNPLRLLGESSWIRAFASDNRSSKGPACPSPCCSTSLQQDPHSRESQTSIPSHRTTSGPQFVLPRNSSPRSRPDVAANHAAAPSLTLGTGVSKRRMIQQQRHGRWLT